MVGILEEIKLITKQRVELLRNCFGEVQNDVIDEETFLLEKGKIYGIVSEHGEGGEMLSALMSGRIPLKEEKVYFDGVKVLSYELQNMGWYVGKLEHAYGILKKEISVRKALNYAIKKYQRYKKIDDVIEDFHLTPDKLDYPLSKYSGERWRASLAVGYACKKEIYCFSWMNTRCFSDILLSSGVFRFFERLKEEGSIIILPTSRKENVSGFVDEIIETNVSRNKIIISEHPYFKEHFRK